MGCPAIAENHIVVRILHFESHYSLFFEDATILSIPYDLLQEPHLGEKMSILRSQEYGFVMQIASETHQISLV